MTSLTDRRAVVIGAEFPAGGAIARALAGAGADVALCALTADEAVMRSRRVRRDIEALGRRAPEYVMDVTLGRNVQVTTRQVAKEMGGLDVVVSAPDFVLTGPIGRVSETELARLVQLTFAAQLFVVRTAADEFRRQGVAGRIVLLTSMLGAEGRSGATAYSAAHAAVHHLVRTAAAELQDDGIAVNAIALDAAETAEGIEAAVPDDLGRIAVDLASASDEFVTGRVLDATGAEVR